MSDVTDWRDVALCTPPEDCPDPAEWLARWFPREYYHGSRITDAAAKAVAVCRECPSIVPCLKYAMDAREPDGIWGGTTPQDRGRVRRRRFAA